VWNRNGAERAAKLLALIGCAEKNLDDATTWGRKMKRHRDRLDLRKTCRDTYGMKIAGFGREDGTE
jgi:hypothetical protein